MDLVALLAAVASRLVLHLLPADRAAVVDHLVVVFYRLDEARYHVQLGLLLDGLPVAIPGWLLQGLVCLDRVDHLTDKFEVIWARRLLLTLIVTASCH